MIRFTGKIATSFVLVLLLISTVHAGEPKAVVPNGDMTALHARRVIVVAASSLFVPVKRNIQEPIDEASMHVSETSIEFDGADADSKNGGKHHYRIPLTSIGSVSVQCDSVGCTLSDVAGKLLRTSTADGNLYFHDNIKEPGQRATCSSRCHKIALDFATALNSLHALALGQASPTDLHQQAMAWRQLATKPPLPEEVRVQRLLAEDAVKNKKPEEALSFYETGLDLYPTWPQGRFNAALIAAELGFYEDAVEHMQAYLELVPDAADAQAARDQVAIWQYKAKGSK